MSSIHNSNFAKSLLSKIKKGKTHSSRKTRIKNCIKNVEKELFTLINIMKEISEKKEIKRNIVEYQGERRSFYEKCINLTIFCEEFDKLWSKQSDDDADTDDDVDDDDDVADDDDVRNRGFYQD